VNIRSVYLTSRVLIPSDVDDVAALYERVINTLPYGFLRKRLFSEFEEGLVDAPDRVAIGAFFDDVLIGYSMCHVAYRDGLTAFPLMRRLRPTKQEYWAGGGTVVEPRFRGHRLMAKLMKARRALATRKKGLTHSLELVAIRNRASLAGILRAGFRIVGLEEDEYCLNFLCYEGSLADDARTFGITEIDIAEIGSLATAFADGWIGTKVYSGVESDRCMLTLERMQGL
jgi:GNAT superfamily N-acetyltransferase